jgi:hypothetical protein
MKNRELVTYRQRVVSAARGRVLEIGIGSGLNLPFYGPGVTEIIGLDPSPTLICMAAERARTGPRAVSGHRYAPGGRNAAQPRLHRPADRGQNWRHPGVGEHDREPLAAG